MNCIICKNEIKNDVCSYCDTCSEQRTEDLWTKYSIEHKKTAKKLCKDNTDIQAQLEKSIRFFTEKQNCANESSDDDIIFPTASKKKIKLSKPEVNIDISPVTKQLDLSLYIQDTARYYPTQTFRVEDNLKTDLDENTLKRVSSKVAKKKKSIEIRIKTLFGRSDVVMPFMDGKKQRYNVRCMVQDCEYCGRSLQSHLIHKHKWSNEKAKTQESKLIKTVKHEARIHKSHTYRPDLCLKCNRYVGRIDLHLVNFHMMQRDDDDYTVELERCRNERKAETITNKTHTEIVTVEKKDAEAVVKKVTTKPKQPQCRTKTLQLNCTLTNERKSFFGITNDLFLTYYKNAKDLFLDFERWLTKSCTKSPKNSAEIVRSCKIIWMSFDSEMTIFPNSLGTPDNIEDYYVMPQLDLLMQNSSLEKEQRKPHFQASTIKSKLCSLSLLFKFSKVRLCFMGLTFKQMEIMALKIQELHLTLKPHLLERQQLIKDWKSDNLITPADCLKYGQSVHIQELIKTMAGIEEGLPFTLTKKEVTDIRNYLMVILTITNASRASNLMNITVVDIKNAQLHDKFNGWVFHSRKYKTSLIYGAKVMVIPDDLYKMFLNYVNLLRPKIAAEENTFLFTSSRDFKSSATIEHSLISNALTKSFGNANVWADAERRISPSMIRCAVVTELVSSGGEKVSTIATHFMKHRESTSTRFYIQHWGKMEAMRIAMRCYGSFLKTTEIDEVIKKREEIARKVPTKTQVKQWIHTNANFSVEDGEVEDKGLHLCLDELDDSSFEEQAFPLDGSNVEFAIRENGKHDEVKGSEVENENEKLNEVEGMHKQITLQGLENENLKEVDGMEKQITLQGPEMHIEDNIHNDPEINDENSIKEFHTVNITESEDGVETHNFHTLNDLKQELKIANSGDSLSVDFSIYQNSDWYCSRRRDGEESLYSRTQILAIVFVAKDIIRTKLFNKEIYIQQLAQAESLGFKRVSEIKDLKWASIKDIVKAMIRKHTKERCHESFEEFVSLSRKMWRMDINI